MITLQFLRNLQKDYDKLEREICCLRQSIAAISVLVTQNIISDEDNLLLSNNTTFYTFNGDAPTTWILPSLVASSGTRRTIVNQGTDVLTINTFAGANDIYDAGVLTDNFVINPGESYIFFNNSIYHTLIQ